MTGTSIGTPWFYRSGGGALCSLPNYAEYNHVNKIWVYNNLITIICILYIGEITDSLFYYEAGADHASLTNSSFVPVFEPVANLNVNQTLVDEVCGTNQFCIYDFQTTGSQSFAQTSVETIEEFQTAIQSLSTGIYCIHFFFFGGDSRNHLF